MLRKWFSYKKRVIDMNKVNITHRNLLFENGLDKNEIGENYKI